MPFDPEKARKKIEEVRQEALRKKAAALVPDSAPAPAEEAPVTPGVSLVDFTHKPTMPDTEPVEVEAEPIPLDKSADLRTDLPIVEAEHEPVIPTEPASQPASETTPTPAPKPEVRDLAQELAEFQEHADSEFEHVQQNLRLASKAIDNNSRDDYNDDIQLCTQVMKELRKRAAALPAEIKQQALAYCDYYEGQYAKAARTLTEGWTKKKGPELFKEKAESIAPETAKPEPQVGKPSIEKLASEAAIHEVPKKDLDALRKEYVAAKKKFEDASSIKNLFGYLHKDSKEKAGQELEKTRKAYEKARGEYVGSHVDRFIDEKNKLVTERMEKVANGKFKKALDGYKKLSDYNAIWAVEKLTGKKVNVKNSWAKFGLKTVNARTLISGGLLVGGYALGAGSLVGITAFALRRGMSFVSGSSGSYDLINMGRNGLNRKGIEKALQDKLIHYEKLEQYMAELESRAILQGRTAEELRQDELYRQLLERYKAEMEREAKEKPEPERMLDERLSSLDDELAGKLKSEKNARLGVAAISVSVGGLLASGYLQNKFGHHAEAQHAASGKAAPAGHGAPSSDHAFVVKHGPKGDVHHTPETAAEKFNYNKIHVAPEHAAASSAETHAPTASAHPAETGHTPTPKEDLATLKKEVVAQHPEVAGQAAELPIGSRGIEGTLLDAIKENKNPKLLEWLHEHYDVSGGNNNPDGLVHRFVLSQGKEHDWNWVGKGSILEIKPNGEIVLDAHKIEFINPPAAAVHEAVAQTTAPAVEFGQAAAPVVAHVDIPVPHPGDPGDNFQMLSEDYIKNHGFDAYVQAMHETTRNTVFNGDDAKALYIVQHARDQAVASLGKTRAMAFEHQIEELAKQGAHPSGEGAVTAAATHPAEAVASHPATSPAAHEVTPTTTHPAEVADPPTPQELAAEHIDNTLSTSDSLIKIWGLPVYGRFMKIEWNLSPEQINGDIGKMTVADFYHKVDTDSTLRSTFLRLQKFIKEYAPVVFKPEDLEKMSVREFLIKGLPKAMKL